MNADHNNAVVIPPSRLKNLRWAKNLVRFLKGQPPDMQDKYHAVLEEALKEPASPLKP